MLVREIENEDLLKLLDIYTHLHENTMPIIDNKLEVLWNKILNDPNHHIIVGIENNMIISTCVVIIVLNLTHNQRPYALVENVITHPEFRNKGYATQILNYAKNLAIENDCYKIMLMTGSKKDTTFRFYERAGYNQNDKTAFIQWIL